MNHLKLKNKLGVMFIIVSVIPFLLVTILGTLQAIVGMKNIQYHLIENKVITDLNAVHQYIAHEFGALTIAGSTLVDENGKDISTHTAFIDQVAEELGESVMLYVKTDKGYESVLTSIKEAGGQDYLEGIIINQNTDPLVYEALQKGEGYIGSLSIEAMRYIGNYQLLYNSNHQEIGAIFVGISRTVSGTMIIKSTMYQVVMGIVIGCTFLIIGLLLVRGISHSITYPVNCLVDYSHEISHYNLNATLSEEIRSRKDEVGHLARGMYTITEKLKSMIIDISQVSGKVSQTATKLANTCRETSVATEEMAKSTQEIANGATEQAEDTSLCLSRLETLEELIDIEEKGMQQLHEASLKVDKLAQIGKEILDGLIVKIKDSNAATLEAYKNMMQTNESARAISSASNIIATVSSQTNLLALNAAIQAARAGESGREFTVVAQEIRNLAEQTAVSTKNIDQQIIKLQQEAEHAVLVTEKVKEMLDEQTKDVIITENKYEEISDAIIFTQQIVDKLVKVSKKVQDYKQEVSHRVESLSAVAQENATTTEEAAACIEEQSASIQDINAATNSLAEMAETLNQMVKYFKL